MKNTFFFGADRKMNKGAIFNFGYILMFGSSTFSLVLFDVLLGGENKTPSHPESTSDTLLHSSLVIEVACKIECRGGEVTLAFFENPFLALDMG